MSYGPPFAFWEKTFRIAAMADDLSILRDHLHRLEDQEVPDNPCLLLEGTIEVVRACLAYASIDHQPIEQFLKMQHYDPSSSSGAYALTFDLYGSAYARLLVDAELKLIDLADLYGHPWEPYRSVGYSRVWITHPDWSQLSKEELAALETAVEEDLLFDYSEDEINLSFQNWPDDSRLIVHVQDVLPEFEDNG